MRRFLLYEADDDNTTSNNAGGGEEAKKDAADFKDDDFTIGDADNADNKEDQKEENQNEEETNEEDTGGEEDDTAGDDDMNAADDEEGGDEDTTGDEEATEDNIYGSSDDVGGQSDSNSLKSIDRELFDSLSIAEQQIKIRELKSLFANLHTDINKIIDKLNLISVDADELSPQVRRSIKVLYTLKEDVAFYILNVYDQKSYMENDTMFNYFLLKLDNIKKVVKSIKNELINDN